MNRQANEGCEFPKNAFHSTLERTFKFLSLQITPILICCLHRYFIHPSWRFGISSWSPGQKMGTAGRLQAINEQEEWLIGLPSQVDHNNIKCLRFLSSSTVYWNWFHCDLNIVMTELKLVRITFEMYLTCRELGMLRNFSVCPSLREKSRPLNLHIRFYSWLSVTLLKHFRWYGTPADDTAL
jgi:hypothetical protein